MIKLKLTSYQQQQLNRDLQRIIRIHKYLNVLIEAFVPNGKLSYKQFLKEVQSIQADLRLQFHGQAEFALQDLAVRITFPYYA